MTQKDLVITGNWIDVVGLIISAVGATRLIEETNDFNRRLVVVGEGLQSFGDALQAIGAEDPISVTGGWIQAAGAGTSSFSVSIQEGETLQEGVRLEVLGDSLQALGAALSVTVEEDEMLIIAGKLESVGAALEAIGALYRLRDQEKKGSIINAVGSWIQAAGGTLAAIVVTKEMEQAQNNKT